jgi:tripartite-type tricarboxylate transporter receptor subunit TctC
MTKYPVLRHIVVSILAITAIESSAQSYPSKPIRLIVPLAAGGGTGSRRGGWVWGGDGAWPHALWHSALRYIAMAMIALVGLGAAVSFAQQFPSKPIRLIVPLAAGGPSDIMARTLALKMGENLRQSVVVDNRAGAGGSVGADLAAKSPADGYTMLLISNSYAINASLYPKLPYDTLKDLTGVSMLASAPYIMTVHPSLPVKSMKELVALAKAKPGQLNYASGGSGTGPHMAMELLKLNAGISLVHIPYKGAGPALIDAIAGHVQALPVNIVAGLPHVKSGKLKVLAVTSEQRSAVLPEVPTVSETVVRGFDEGGQHGILVPSGTPREIIARLHQEIVKVLQSPDVSERLRSEGAAVVGNTPDQYNEQLRADVAKWAKVIKVSGIRAN